MLWTYINRVSHVSHLSIVNQYIESTPYSQRVCTGMYFAIVCISNRHTTESSEGLIIYNRKFFKALVRAAAKVRNLDLLTTCLKINRFILNHRQIEWKMRRKKAYCSLRNEMWRNANYRFSFRKLQILISQTTDFHFANHRFSFRRLQISKIGRASCRERV